MLLYLHASNKIQKFLPHYPGLSSTAVVASYLLDITEFLTSLDSVRPQRSADQNLLAAPPIRLKTNRGCAFSDVSAQLWSSPPLSVRSILNSFMILFKYFNILCALQEHF